MTDLAVARWTRLGPVFSPDSIAVVGASATPYAIGNTVYANLRRDFPGRLYPVNPRRAEVLGDRAYPDVADLPEPVDLVIVLIPARDVPALLERCIAAGHRSAYIISSAFSEAGTDEGRAAQAAVSEIAARHAFPVVGPNCIGFMNGHRTTMANFSLQPDAERPLAGPVAIVSQSGGFGSFILNRAVVERARVGFFASTGNEADVTIADVIRYAVEQPEIGVIATFAEATRDPATLLEAARRAAELDKVIISVTPASSEAVARAALSHTASVVGSSQVYDAVCDQYGIVRAGSIAELIDYATFLQDGKRMRGRRIAVLTSSGGAGVLAASNVAETGLEMPELSPPLQARISPLMPSFGSARNPVDTTAAVTAMAPENWGLILGELCASDEIDAVMALVWGGDSDHADTVVKLYEQDKPIAPVVTIGPEKLADRGLPAFADPTRAIRALSAMAAVSARAPAGPPTHAVDQERADWARATLAEAAGEPIVLEATSKRVLARYGIPVTREVVCHTEDEAVAALAEIGGRVALKVQSYDLPHKSDSGGLVLGLATPDEVRAAYRRLARLGDGGVRLHSLLVQEMVPARLEMAIGMHRDPVFGPVVAVGLGGSLIEVIGEPALLHPPFTRERAVGLITRLAGGRITHAVRGLGADHIARLADAARGLATLALDLPELESVDINPVMVTDTGIVAADALMVLR
ncbi:acetate--CoA ligase family protein [Paractinoplanes globisporus]|uniref:Acetate--CoA ligase family protein n=1 Tax=Paractinoplanes globisporus TaxID=113565 RepID=A0ABW6W9C8_9ACTN|nr:acetate--CoA ligase family protein [Actinoplanes globisporus]